MTDRDPHPDSFPDNDNDASEDRRSDTQQAVEARSDAIKRGEGGEEPATMTDTGIPDGVGGTGGVTKNQDEDAQ